MQLHCPHCSTVLEIQSPAGTQVQCPTCSGVFLVPELPSSAAPPPQIQTRPNPPGRKSAPSPPQTSASQSSAAGEHAAGDESLSFWKRHEKLIFNIVAGGVGAVALFLVFALAKSMLFDRGDQEAVEEVATPENTNVGNQIQEVLDRSESDPDYYVNWSDASKKNKILDGLRVKVHHVEWGEVRGRDEQGELVTSGRPFMIVFLELANRSPNPIDFKTWYGTEFKSPAGFRTAQLSDQQRNIYYPLRFDDIVALKWNTPQKTFAPKEEGTDSIVFDVGEDFDPRSVENLYLDLPGQAIGDGGSFRFRIPRSMIEGID
ncbi:MAG: hypothetical protein ACIALR_07590 [Blastopirellula sp. JB062]